MHLRSISDSNTGTGSPIASCLVLSIIFCISKCIFGISISLRNTVLVIIYFEVNNKYSSIFVLSTILLFSSFVN